MPTLDSPLFRFLAVGAGCTALQFGILHALVSAGLGAVAASCLGFVASACVNYLANRRFTFRSDVSHGTGAPRFATSALLGLGINALAMAAMRDGLGLHHLWAQAVATVLVTAWNFSLARRWVFAARAR